MKRLSLMAPVVLAACLVPGLALAQEPTHRDIGVGFRSTDAPIGGRWWLEGQQIGIDAGLGVSNHPSGVFPDENLTDWRFEVGFPILMRSWEHVHIIFRPGLQYESLEQTTTFPPAGFDSDSATTFGIGAELEAEVFVVRNISISASQGFIFTTSNPAGGGDDITTFNTTGTDFTSLGFHVYLFGD